MYLERLGMTAAEKMPCDIVWSRITGSEAGLVEYVYSVVCTFVVVEGM